MSALGSKLRRLQGGLVAFWCPGCNEPHQLRVEGEAGSARGWNGDGDRPTFTPSVLVTVGHYCAGWSGPECWCTARARGEDWDFECSACHSFVTDGQVLFLGDCTHKLAGQTVALPDYPEGTP